MDSLKPLGSLKLTGNVDSNWRTFKQQFQLYIAAMGLEMKPDTRKEVAPKSFTVRTEEGHIFRRNRRSLLKTQETVPEIGKAHTESESISPPVTDCNTNAHTL
ncbi:unnamed protein product, partial [Leuciscus chuanchicus]